MGKILTLFLVLGALLMPGLVRGDVAKTGQARLTLSIEGPAQFSGDTESKNFWVRLPAHIYPESGELNLSLRAQPTLLSLVAGLEMQVNGTVVSTTSLDGINPLQATNAPLRVVAKISPKNLQPGGNRLTLHFLFRKTAESNQDVLKNTTWAFESSNSYFTLAYERPGLFPEMRRFPESLAEEKLLQPDASPLLTLLLPSRLRDAHLRACAVFAARLGQLGYVAEQDCRTAWLDQWQAESQARSGLIVGTRDDLTNIDLPSRISASLKGLRPGQGLLAEFILGEAGNQRRWVLASGADDLGLDRAVMTLGHSKAMAALPSNPAIIETEPTFEPGIKPVQPRSSIWTQAQSFLTSAAMRITGAIYGSESKDVSGMTQVPVDGKPSLQCVHRLLMRDTSLQEMAFLMPKSASLEQAKLLFDLSLYMGSQVPSSPVLWPEACTFSRSTPPAQARLQDRTVLLLAPVSEWGNAISSGMPLEVRPQQPGQVRVQGRAQKLSAFEPTLGFLYMRASPWSKESQVVAAGGWLESSAPAVKDLIKRAAPAGKLAGNLCAADSRGRVAVYDTSHPKLDSFMQVLQKHIPEGLTEAETRQQLEAADLRATHSAGFNRTISWVVGGWLVLLVAARFLLLWIREWGRRQTLREENKLLEMTQ